MEFPEDLDYDSIAGYVMQEAGAVPEVGFSCTLQGFEFLVREADERHVELVEARPSPPGPEAELATA